MHRIKIRVVKKVKLKIQHVNNTKINITIDCDKNIIIVQNISAYARVQNYLW